MNRTNLPVARPAHMKQLSRLEMEERRSRGLYFNCDEPFALGHRCKRLFRLEVAEDRALDDKNSNKNLDDLGISLYVITWATDGHTMQVTGCIHSLSPHPHLFWQHPLLLGYHYGCMSRTVSNTKGSHFSNGCKLETPLSRSVVMQYPSSWESTCSMWISSSCH